MSQKSKEELEKIYNKGQNFRQGFKSEFDMKSSELKKFNDLHQDTKNEEQDDYFSKHDEDDEENINIEAVKLLTNSALTINTKYQSPLQVIKCRITTLRTILVVMHAISQIICYFFIEKLFDLVGNGKVIIYQNDKNPLIKYFEFKRNGSHILYGSQWASFYIYIFAMILYGLHLIVPMLPQEIFIVSEDQPKKLLAFREFMVKLFKVFSLFFGVGCFSQIFFYHYTRAAKEYQPDNQNQQVWILAYAVYFFIIQGVKIFWNISLIYLTQKLKLFCEKYVREMEKLEKITRK